MLLLAGDASADRVHLRARSSAFLVTPVAKSPAARETQAGLAAAGLVWSRAR